VFRNVFPLFQEFTGQQLEALRTGGVGAQVPIIQRSVEQAKLATASGLQSAEQGLAAQGLSGTPFAARTLAQVGQQGRLLASQIPTDIAQQFIAGIPQMSQIGLTGAAQLGGAALGGLGDIATAAGQAASGESSGKGAGVGGGAAAIGTIIAVII
jgi:hypothetical protein